MPREDRAGDVKVYQERVRNSLIRIFGENNVKEEWDAAKNSRDGFTRRFYCPRLDIAVGPFNIDRNIDYNKIEIQRTLEMQKDLVSRIYDFAEEDGTLEDFLTNSNENPRCFLAIEIEKSGSRKHMLGDIANASILGSIGIIVPFTDEKMSHFRRIKQYVIFAANAGKTSSLFKNILILNKENFLGVLESSSAITPT